MMRVVLALVVAVALTAGCKKGTTVTAPVIADSLAVSGAWTGCITEPHVTCEPVTMTLTDSVTTDTTETVTGTGNWGDNVTITGRLLNSNLSLNAAATGVLQGWSFAGVLSGNSLIGNMSLPGVDSTFQTVFTRTP